MLIIDAHLDLAWNAIDWNRDLLSPVAELRKSEAGMSGKARGVNTVSLPEMRRGHVAVSLMTLLARQAFAGNPWPGYNASEAVYAAARGQLAYYQALAAKGAIRIITSSAALREHLTDWEAAVAASDAATLMTSGPPLGCIIAMEGADPILAPDQLKSWFDQGLRVVSLTHYGRSRYAHGTQTVGGLMPQAPALLAEMARLGVVLDVTHLCDQSFWEALDHYHGPVLASHHNSRALVPDERQLSDDQLRALIERDAVIGTALDAWMLYPGWIKGETSPSVVDLSAVADHIDHVCQLAGNTKHAALGTDLDGGFGKEQTPHDLDTIADLQRIAELLAKRGYAPADIEAIMWRNWAGFFERVL